MSFKGFQKAIVRAPQNFRQKLHMGTVTEDAVYMDAERRFQELESETKRLSDESKRYHKAVNEMLDHQLSFSKAIEEIYKPISGRMSDPNSAIPEGNPEGIEACEQYRDVVNELKETLKPDLELIETRIVEPAQELLKIIQAIRKMATKRSHKQLDLDRHQNTLSKYQNKKDPKPKDEEKIYKYENEVAIAQQEFDYYNEMMKTELPILFQLEAEMVKPLFISLYYMQLNVFYTLASRMEEMKIPYFDLSQDIIEAFNLKRGDIEERADAISVTHFKVGHAKCYRLCSRCSRCSTGYAPGAPGATGYAPGATGYAPSAVSSPVSSVPTYNSYGATGTPPSTAGYTGTYPGAASTYGGYGYANEKAEPPAYSPVSPISPIGATTTPVAGAFVSPTTAPPAAANAAVPGVCTCTALYDYTAQAAGDLTFRAGDVITVYEKTDANGWWKGELNGVMGVFPGNYVQLNQ
ncbi:unnamed protein product [Pichia kudriavzevii]